MSPQANPPARHRFVTVLVLVVFVGLVARLLCALVIAPQRASTWERELLSAAAPVSATAGEPASLDPTGTGATGLLLVRVAGRSIRSLRVLDAVLGTLAVGTVALIAARTLSPLHGLLAGAACALAPPCIDQVAWLWPMHVAPVWIIGLVAMGCAALGPVPLPVLILLGAVTGVSRLIDPLMAGIWVPLGVGLVLFSGLAGWRRAVLFCVTAGVVSGVCGSALRSSELSGGFGASDAPRVVRGMPFWLFLETEGWAMEPSALPATPIPDDIQRALWERTGRFYELEHWAVGWRTVAQRPGRAARLVLTNAYRLWLGGEEGYGVGRIIPDWLTVFGRVTVVALAFCSVVIWRLRPVLGLTALLIGYWTVAIAFTCPMPGERLVGYPLLLLLAVVGAMELAKGCRTAHRGSSAVLIGCVVAALGLGSWVLRPHPQSLFSAWIASLELAWTLEIGGVLCAVVLVTVTLCGLLMRNRTGDSWAAGLVLGSVFAVGALLGYGDQWANGTWTHPLKEPSPAVAQHFWLSRQIPAIQGNLLLRVRDPQALRSIEISVNGRVIKPAGQPAAQVMEGDEGVLLPRDGLVWYSMELERSLLTAQEYEVSARAVDGGRTVSVAGCEGSADWQPLVRIDTALYSLLWRQGALLPAIPAVGPKPAFHLPLTSSEFLSFRREDDHWRTDDLSSSRGVQTGGYDIRLALGRLPRVEWETAPVTADGSIVVVFAGVSAHQATPARLLVNGREALRFLLGRPQDEVWRAERAELVWEHERQAGPLSGVYYLRLDRLWIAPGQPLVLTVEIQPDGGFGKGAWFALLEVADLADTLPMPVRNRFEGPSPTGSFGGYTRVIHAPRRTLVRSHFGIAKAVAVPARTVWEIY